MKKRLKNHIINNGIKIEFFNLRNFNRSIELKSSKNYLYYKFVDDLKFFLDRVPINLISPLSKSVRNEREGRQSDKLFHEQLFEARGEFECHRDNG